MWSMPVVLTETENEKDSANQNDVAKNEVAKMTLQTLATLSPWQTAVVLRASI